jgi:hypothetical protein
MCHWLNLGGVIGAVLGMTIVVGMAVAGDRHAGTVLSVSADRLVLEELGAAGNVQRLTLRLTPDTAVMLSVRNEHPEDFYHIFTTTSISAVDIKPGDFVVVELNGRWNTVADSVTVTLQKPAGSR